ncbi:MAG: hypothetical protein GOV15_04630 [Candidatus Diapherotrites archaeon]|nr:hypothetical protein [Candidatus Diapherotrites archaeon]
MVKQALKDDLARIEAILEGRSVKPVFKPEPSPEPVITKVVPVPVAKPEPVVRTVPKPAPKIESKASPSNASKLFEEYQGLINEINVLEDEQLNNRDNQKKVLELQAKESELQVKADKFYHEYLKVRG